MSLKLIRILFTIILWVAIALDSYLLIQGAALTGPDLRGAIMWNMLGMIMGFMGVRYLDERE